MFENSSIECSGFMVVWFIDGSSFNTFVTRHPIQQIKLGGLNELKEECNYKPIKTT